MLPSETMIWQPEFTDKTLSRKPGAVHSMQLIHHCQIYEPYSLPVSDPLRHHGRNSGPLH
ncbi:hypothetical protein EWM66_07010 [Escherichia coli O157:H7]|nr:hypothetical protein EWM66_07010 [Escherichia coli O157:H7]QJZ94857.1 hypothetical protein E3166_17495 [Escherichia coli O157:H7]QKA43435.1 hypothetical protein E4U63_17525 [Escherichia coli O157:H7]